MKLICFKQMEIFSHKNPFQWYNLSSIYKFFLLLLAFYIFIYYILYYKKSPFFFFLVLRDHQLFVLNHMISYINIIKTWFQKMWLCQVDTPNSYLIIDTCTKTYTFNLIIFFLQYQLIRFLSTVINNLLFYFYQLFLIELSLSAFDNYFLIVLICILRIKTGYTKHKLNFLKIYIRFYISNNILFYI